MDTFKDPTTKARFFQAMNESLALGISLEGFVRNDTVERDKALKEIGNRTMNSETRERLRKMGEKKYDETLTELETQITKESDTTKKSALEATLKGLKENKEGFFSSWMRSGEHLWALGGSGMYGASGSIDFTKVDGMFEGMKLSA